MPMMRCPECREQVSSRAIACPHCGYPIGGEDGGGEKLSRISILAILVFFFAIAATWGTIFFPGALAAILEELANLVIAIANRLR
jgi:hypothetical protein